MLFNETGTATGYQQKTGNANQDVTEDKFLDREAFIRFLPQICIRFPHSC